MNRILFTVVVFIVSFSAAFGQMNYQQQYLNAKGLYNKGQYALAIEAFRPIIKRDPQNPFAPYASFYFGLSTFKAGYPLQAKDIFLQTKERFPNWSRIDEVNYWLAASYFENNDDYLALNVLNNIKDPGVKEDSKGLIYHYVMPDTDVEEMAGLYERYKNPVIGQIYAAKLSSAPLDAEGREMLEGLVETYGLDRERYLSAVHTSELKDSYKIAVLMPFLVNSLKPNDKQRVNEFVLELYQGIRLGFDSLKKNGINLEVYAYDTRRDTTATRQILQNDELKGMDMIIGPLFSGPMRIVNEFSHQYGINVINPLSSSPEYIAGNPFHFLYNPSVLTVGEVMAEYVFENYGDKPGIVFFEENPNDQILAQAYTDRFKELGGKLSIVQGIDKDETREILEILLSSRSIKDASTEEGRENMSIEADSIGSIFVASANSLIFSKVIGAVDTRGDNIRVIGAAEWMDSPVVKFDVYERLGVTFYAPGYIDKNGYLFDDFREKYMRKHRSIPTEYAEKGYELALFFGESLKKYGSYPQVGWQEQGKIKGSLGAGFNYHGVQDNQVVPILVFDEDGLKMIARERKANDEDR